MSLFQQVDVVNFKEYDPATDLIDFRERTSQIIVLDKRFTDWALSINTCNRVPRKKDVARYCNAMLSGDWVLNNQGIGISRNGYLVDGQQRLLAHRDAGYPPITVSLITGLDDAAMNITDKGSKRTQRDALRIAAGIDISDDVIAAINAIHCIKTEPDGNRVIQTYKSTTTEEQIKFLNDFGYALAPIRMKNPAPITAALFEYAVNHSILLAVDFATRLRYGYRHNTIPPECGDPIMRLATYLKSLGSSRSSNRNFQYKATMYAAIKHAHGEHISKMGTYKDWSYLPKTVNLRPYGEDLILKKR